MSSTIRTVLPLSIVTATSMLAMDLFLPAVPTLQASLGIDVTLAQATIAVFLAGLAASQLIWGEAMTRLGPRRCVGIGVSLLVLSAFGCALAPDIGWLLAMRALQGAAAGASTVVAPSVVRATLSDEHAVKGIASIAMIESAVPAAGPLLGSALLLAMDWRATFWILGGVTLLALPFVVRVTPRELPGLDRTAASGYLAILGNRKYLRLALCHALCFGALLSFVASAPQLMVHAFGLGAGSFAALQLMSVLCFMAVASQSGRISRRFGAARAVQFGCVAHVALCGGFVLVAWLSRPGFAGVAVFWCAFCAVLAVRGPAAFSEALALPPVQMGRASAMLMLAILAAGALGTQGVAPFMSGPSALPLASAMLALCIASLAMVLPYPHVRTVASQSPASQCAP
jgi:MFS family permease